jgi:hypothetical protein
MECAHVRCGCEVSEGQEYCSDYCRQPSGMTGTSGDCGCGHDACTAM